MSIKDILTDKGVLSHVVLPPGIDLLLSGLEPIGPPQPLDASGGIIEGEVQLSEGLSKSPLPGFDFALTLPTGVIKPAPFKLMITPTSFKFWLVLSRQGQVYAGFKLVERIPGLGLTGAEMTTDGEGMVTLTALPDGSPGSVPMLVSRSEEAGSVLAPSLLVSGSASSPAGIRFTPDTDSEEGIVAFGFDPPAVVFGGSGIGFHCPLLVMDDSVNAHGPGSGAPWVDPPLVSISADDDSWRGFLARQLDFYLPASVPFFGGRPIKGYFAIPFGDGGVELVVETKVAATPATGTRSAQPGYRVRIECIDPTARGVSGLVPTLISASMELPLDGAQAPVSGGGPVTFSAGKPVIATAAFARDPVNDPTHMRFTLGLSAQGPKGLLSVTTGDGTPVLSPPKLFTTAVAMATALIANDEAQAEGGDVVLAVLAAAGAALSSLFEPDSEFVLNGVEIESTGHGLPLGEKVTLNLDYSVAVRVVKLEVPRTSLSVGMRKDQPMRLRVRGVRMSIDLRRSGLDMIGLDYDRAEMEVENPGAWDVGGLEQLFDVVGSRSGRGSSWIEVDLRFKLNLGPIQVSGLTIRATLNGGVPEATVQGLRARLLVPSAIDGEGNLHMVSGGFDAHMRASILPLKVVADAGIIYKPPKVVLGLGVDLPAPIPLANSGLGLMGVGGLFGIAAVPNYASSPEKDPVLRQLWWRPRTEVDFSEAPGQFTFGLEAVVGTLPDLGFTFAAKAGILITVPNLAVRGALNGRVLQPPVTMADTTYPPTPGLSFIGFVGVDSTAVDFAVIGTADLAPLLKVRVPVVGHYPFTPADNWYTYLGADGHPSPEEGRAVGPISAEVLPGILDLRAEAYLMARGRGITAWPHGRPLPRPPLTIDDGLVVAFGFALQNTFGFKPIAWAELYASLDLLVGARPVTLAGFGRAGGSLHLGPFSIGVQAQVSFLAQEDTKHFWAEVTGKIELLFFDIEGKVTLSFGKDATPTLPPPDRHPLDLLDAEGQRIGSSVALTDDSYRVLTRLAETPEAVTDDQRVWPDAMISVPFAFPPEVKVGPDSQFPGARGPGATPPTQTIGTEMLNYIWHLDRVELLDVTDETDKWTGAGTRPSAQLPARWQVPRHSSIDDVSELLLGSTEGGLWVNRRSDGGKELGDPLGRIADLCNQQPTARPGWAIGHLAHPERTGFRLPPDQIARDPIASRVEAHMHHSAVPWEGELLSLDHAFTLPAPYSLTSARVITAENPFDPGVGRHFLGTFVAPSLHWLDGLDATDLVHAEEPYIEQRLALEPQEPIGSGLLVLVGAPQIFESMEQADRVMVEDTSAQNPRWHRQDIHALDDGQVAVVFTQETNEAITAVTITYPLGVSLGIAGLCGLTMGAVTVADAERESISAFTATLSAAANDGPPSSPVSLLPSTVKPARAVLDPGRLYRLDIDMSWSGQLYQQDEQGSRVLVTRVDAQDQYAPRGGGDKRTRRQLFFGTTRTVAQEQSPAKGATGYASWLYRSQDVFQPEMIERYFAGYEPGQSEEFRFCDDPLRAHFSQNHVRALATAYGFALSIAVRRTDRPGPQHEHPVEITPSWSFITNPKFLGAVDQIRYAEAFESPCKQPLPGATAAADPVALDTQAWYEVYVLAKPLYPHDGFAEGRLPGVSFRTSRWRNPEQMFAGLGLSVESPTQHTPEPVMVGDLPIPGTAISGEGVIEGNDQAYLDALTALKLDDWPVARAPRLSRLWVDDGAGGWLFGGLMIESPEPVHRPRRLEITGLEFSPGSAGPSLGFEIHRRDRSGSRLLYLTGNPFPVTINTVEAQLVLRARSTRAPVDLAGHLMLPFQPAFAEEF